MKNKSFSGFAARSAFVVMIITGLFLNGAANAAQIRAGVAKVNITEYGSTFDQ